MTPEYAAIVVACIAGAVVANRDWLRSKTTVNGHALESLNSRLTRVENEVRNRPLQIAPNQLPPRMSAR